MAKAYDTAQAIADPERRELAMHDVRKAAKRARYTAEALKSTLGKPMVKLAKLAENVQEVLGTHQDGVVAQETAARGGGGQPARRVRTPSRTACSSAWNGRGPAGTRGVPRGLGRDLAAMRSFSERPAR